MKEAELKRLFKRFKALKSESWQKLISRGTEKVGVYLSKPFAQSNLGKKSFQVLGERYDYFIHTYNATWRNERAIEIPIALNFLKKFKGKRVLELGNVLCYYGPEVDRHVVDKYENSPNVSNVDFIEFVPNQLYDAFISISTVEHIGWDELPKDPEKVVKAFQHLPKVVRDLDNVLISFPLGYNAVLDKLVEEERIKFKRSSYLVRKTKDNQWEEANKEAALSLPYGSQFNAANALFVGRGFIDVV